MKAISIKQPWAYLIASGIKDIENRTWKCPEKYIGQRILIHASAMPCIDIYNIFSDDQKAFIFNNTQKSVIESIRIRNACKIVSSIIGSVEIVDCVVNHTSIWAEKQRCTYHSPCKDLTKIPNCWDGCTYFSKPIYNWVLANPILFDEPITNVKGRLGFWDFVI